MITLAGLALGLALSSVVLVLALPVTIAVPAVVAGSRRLVNRRSDRAAAARALDVLRATQASLRSGMPLAPALRSAVSTTRSWADDPFARVARSIELNAAPALAVHDVSHQSADRRVSIALQGIALAAAEQLPATRSAQLIGSVADRIAHEQRLRDEVAARASGVRGQIVLLALLVPGITLYLLVTLPGLAETLATPLCRFVLIPLAAVLELAGIIASRAIVRDLA